MYICINSYGTIKERDIVTNESIEPYPKRVREEDFVHAHYYCFRVRYNEKKIKKIFGIKYKSETVYVDYYFYLYDLSTENMHLFYQEIAFYVVKIRRINPELLKEFKFTIEGTLVELQHLINQNLSEIDVRDLIIETGEVFKNLYESLRYLIQDDTEYKEKSKQLYLLNLGLKNQFLIDFKNM